MENETPQTKTSQKRKSRILQSIWARIRRHESKFALKKHKEKEHRELTNRYEGKIQQLSKEKRSED